MPNAARDRARRNRALMRQGRLDLFVGEEVLADWLHTGPRRRGGRKVYSDLCIQTCSMLRELLGLGLRPTTGPVESIMARVTLALPVPDHTTLQRRAAALTVDLDLGRRCCRGAMAAIVVAVDATGLTVTRRGEWNALEHGRADGRWQSRWRKLHVAIDVASGAILAACTGASRADCQLLPLLLDRIEAPLAAVRADMAYDTVTCRRAVHQRRAEQRIPPERKARASRDNRNLRAHRAVLAERDAAIAAILARARAASPPDQPPEPVAITAARRQWKKDIGCHRRPLVATTMARIKAHASDRLSNRREDTRETQAPLKCATLNRLAQAA
jgi:hypothetical protein